MKHGSARESQDDQWQEYIGNPILSPEGTEVHTRFGSVLIDGSGLYHCFYDYYAGSPARSVIGHATSTDGLSWTKDTAHNPILEKGTAGAWDDYGVCVPMCTWIEGDTWYMIYRGEFASGTKNTHRLGLATAPAAAGPWTKSVSNPIITGTEAWELNTEFTPGLDPCGILKIGSIYYLYYSSIKSPADWTYFGGSRSIGVATSTNLTAWTKNPNNPFLSGHRFCGCVFKYGEYYYIAPQKSALPGGAPYAKGYLELWRSTSPLFTNPEFVRIIHKAASEEAWDAGNQDTTCIVVDNIYRNSFPGNKIMMYYTGCDLSTTTYKMGVLIENDIDEALGVR